eukprot:gene23918-9489_t
MSPFMREMLDESKNEVFADLEEQIKAGLGENGEQEEVL